MTKAKMETAAERYRRIREEKEKSQSLYDVTCSECEMTWKARKIGTDFWVTSGVLPLHLVETMLSASKKVGQKPADLLKQLAVKEVLQSIEFSSKVVKATAVEPRIVETIADINDISQEEVLTCCYKSLLQWQMGGGEPEALETFPKE